MNSYLLNVLYSYILRHYVQLYLKTVFTAYKMFSYGYIFSSWTFSVMPGSFHVVPLPSHSSIAAVR